MKHNYRMDSDRAVSFVLHTGPYGASGAAGHACVMGAYAMVREWLHIETTVGDPWVLPIWGAVNKAVELKRVPPLCTETRELGIHVSTRLDILPYVVSRINSEVREVYELAERHEPDNVFTANQDGYVLQMPRKLVYSLLADIDSLLFELNSVCELMTSLFETLHSYIGMPLGKGQAGSKIKRLLETNGSDSRWFQELDAHRNFFIHEGSPYFGIDISDGPDNYDLLIMKENLNLKSFDDTDKFISLSQIGRIVRGFTTAKPLLQRYLIELFFKPDLQPD